MFTNTEEANMFGYAEINTDPLDHLSQEIFAKSKFVYHVCRRMLSYRMPNSETIAEDLTQVVMIKAWQRRQTFREGAILSTWLIAIAKNTVLDYFRHYKRINTRTVSLEDILDGADHRNPWSLRMVAEFLSINHTEDRYVEQLNSSHDLLRLLIDGLPPKYREPLKLYIRGYKYAEITQLLGIPQGTVKSRINRGTILLHDKHKRLLE